MKKIDLFEAMRTQRAIRDFTDQPVSDEALTTILEAATWAPSGGNTQPWEFVLVRDEAVKQKVLAFYRMAADRYTAMLREEAKHDMRVRARLEAFPPDFARSIGEALLRAPLWIVVCLNRRSFNWPEDQRHADVQRKTAYASIYPAVQNMLLAARALGLGAVLTTLHAWYEEEVKEILGIPEHVDTMALIPLGHTTAKYEPKRRAPVRDVTHYDRWGRQTF